ncbi:MAG: GNAT family N-acetyltransferase [Bacteroidia bacterium]
MSNKEKYKVYCINNKVALYQNDWWMDAVCGDNWDAVFTENSALAFPFKKKYNLKLIQMPMLTLGLGTISEEAITQLPSFDLLDLYFLPNEKAEAVEWKGFKKNIRHSYHLSDISNTGKVFSGFASSTRQQIRKAQKAVAVSESNDVAMLYKMISLTFARQKKKTPYTLAYVKNIYEACTKHKACKILVAKDAEGNIHGACLLAYDKQTAYYIMGGSDPKYKSSAAYSLLMWEAIQEGSKHSREFNFCGSSVPSIAKFFSGFGASPQPYLHLKKVNSKALKLFLALKGK